MTRDDERRGQVALLWPAGRRPQLDEATAAHAYEMLYRPQLGRDAARLHQVFLASLLPNGIGFDEYLKGTQSFKTIIARLPLANLADVDAAFAALHDKYIDRTVIVFNRAAQLVARDFETLGVDSGAPGYKRALIGAECYDTGAALGALAHKMTSAEGMAEMYVARLRDGAAGESATLTRWVDAHRHTDMVALRERLLGLATRLEQERRGRLAARPARPQSDADETRARGNIRVVVRNDGPRPARQPA